MFTYLFLLAEKAANRKSCFTCRLTNEISCLTSIPLASLETRDMNAIEVFV